MFQQDGRSYESEPGRDVVPASLSEADFGRLTSLACPAAAPKYLITSMGFKSFVQASLAAAMRECLQQIEEAAGAEGAGPGRSSSGTLFGALKEARERGLIPVHAPSDLDRRLDISESFVSSLLSNPSKVVSPSSLTEILREGLTSTARRNVSTVIDFIGGDEDAVHLTYGLPYVALKGLCRAERDKCLLVLDGKAIASRFDCQILSCDTGVIVRDNNPLSPWVHEMNSLFPECRKTQLDFLRLALDEIRRHPRLLAVARKMAQEAIQKRELNFVDLESYLATVFAWSFPFPGMTGGRFDEMWLKPYLPEGKVQGAVKPEEIRAALVFSDSGIEIPGSCDTEIQVVKVEAGWSQQRRAASMFSSWSRIIRAESPMRPYLEWLSVQ